MKDIFRTFGRGLATVLPIFLTMYLIYWLVFALENVVERIMLGIFGEDTALYFNGLGIILFTVTVFAVGCMSNTTIFGRVWKVLEDQIEKIPLVKSIYGALKDFMAYFSSAKGKSELGAVVLVKFENPDVKLMGFTTGNDFEFLDPETEVSVYLPMSYQVGGYLMMVKRSQIEVLNMSFEDGMRLILTAGVSQNNHPDHPLDEPTKGNAKPTASGPVA